ncbi:putative odorant receptor 92a isoform X2 [Choristoneura fumiferana]|uniref:putative odorant receptor 92a isoform X2 n=1 Tax=Choristoneura fumiferana TaxID=7141 RepID=UPI003D1546B2
MDTPTFKNVFKIIKFNFSLMGIPSNKSMLTLKFFFLVSSVVLMLVEEVSFFVKKMAPENFLELTILAPCICVGLLSVLKIIPVALHRSTVFDLADELNSLSTKILIDPKKNNGIKRDIMMLRKLIKYYFILNLLLISVYNFSTPFYILYHYIMTREEIFFLPYAVVVPFSTETWLNWFIVYLHSIFCGFICVLFFTTVDGLYFILTSYLCSLFAVLSKDTQELSNINDNALNEIVKRHRHVLKLADDLELIFTLPNFFNVMVGAVEICVLGLTLMIGDWGDIPGCLLFLSSVLLQIFMISVFGEKLITESTKISDSAYLCKWYEMNSRSKNTILLLMIRAQKPQRLSANKFSVICLKGFCKIISNSWSYFTILRTVYYKE